MPAFQAIRKTFCAKSLALIRGERFGATIRFGGDGLSVLTAEPARQWDAVVLVQYPHRSAFKNTIDDPEYQVAFKLGISAIAEIVLQPLKRIDGLT